MYSISPITNITTTLYLWNNWYFHTFVHCIILITIFNFCRILSNLYKHNIMDIMHLPPCSSDKHTDGQTVNTSNSYWFYYKLTTHSKQNCMYMYLSRRKFQPSPWEWILHKQILFSIIILLAIDLSLRLALITVNGNLVAEIATLRVVQVLGLSISSFTRTDLC